MKYGGITNHLQEKNPLLQRIPFAAFFEESKILKKSEQWWEIQGWSEFMDLWLIYNLRRKQIEKIWGNVCSSNLKR